MALAISYLHNVAHDATSNLRLALHVLIGLDILWLIAFWLLNPFTEQRIIPYTLVILNCVVTPLIVYFKRNTRRAYATWLVTSIKLVSTTGALCLYELATWATLLDVNWAGGVHEEEVSDDAGIAVPLFILVTLLVLTYGVETALLFARLIQARDMQGVAAMEYAARQISKESEAGLLDATHIAVQIKLAMDSDGHADTAKVAESISHLNEMARQDFIQRLTTNTLSNHHFALAATFVLLLSSMAFVFETSHIISSQAPVFDAEAVNFMRNMSTGYETEAGAPMRFGYKAGDKTHNGTKVMVIVMDGLRLDYAHELDFWSNSSYKATCGAKCVSGDDMAFIPASNQLPSMSVPNWLTTVTGTPPEVTGVLGNMFVPDTAYESIFSMAQEADIMRMITGTPWFAGIVASKLPFLRGDGTVDAAYNTEETTQLNSEPADAERQKVALQALRMTTDPYGLMLVHYSDIDSQGHCCGVTPAYNTNNTYVKAVHTKRSFLQALLEAQDDDTVTVVVSDHGHIDRGGHGASDAHLRDIPLFIYKKGSALSTISIAQDVKDYTVTPGAADEWRPAAVTNLDIAPTVCELLGVPTPGQALGRFIRPVLEKLVPAGIQKTHDLDMYAQRYAMVDLFRLGFRLEDTPMPDLHACEEQIAADGNCEAAIDALNALYFNTLRPSAMSVTVNVVLGIILVLTLWTGTLLLMEHTTPASPVTACCPRRFTARVSPGDATTLAAGVSDKELGAVQVDETGNSDSEVKETEDGVEGVVQDDSNISRSQSPAQLEAGRWMSRKATRGWLVQAGEADDRYMRRAVKVNRVGLTWAIVGCLGYYALSTLIFVVVYKVLGYPAWDSTVIHSPNAAKLYLAVALLPSSISAFAIGRLYRVYYQDWGYIRNKWAKPGFRAKLSAAAAVVRRLLRDDKHSLTRSMEVYMVDQYFVQTAVTSCLFTLLMASSFSFPYPGVLRIHFVSASRWDLRFRVITVLAFNLPLVAMSLYNMWTWDWANVSVTDYEDFLETQGIDLPDDLFSDTSRATQGGHAKHPILQRVEIASSKLKHRRASWRQHQHQHHHHHHHHHHHQHQHQSPHADRPPPHTVHVAQRPAST